MRKKPYFLTPCYIEFIQSKVVQIRDSLYKNTYFLWLIYIYFDCLYFHEKTGLIFTVNFCVPPTQKQVWRPGEMHFFWVGYMKCITSL